jgi:hypothetical protein
VADSNGNGTNDVNVFFADALDQYHTWSINYDNTGNSTSLQYQPDYWANQNNDTDGHNQTLSSFRFRQAPDCPTAVEPRAGPFPDGKLGLLGFPFNRRLAI